MRLLTVLFKIVCIVLIVPALLSLYHVFVGSNWTQKPDLYFYAGLLATYILVSIFVKPHGYFGVLLHELTHNFLSVLTFNKPVGINVRAHEGGVFQFQGRQNILIVLAPYFFPTLTIVWFPIYFILASSAQPVYFVILGLTFGISQVLAIRQAHVQQTDLSVFGLVWSYLFIVFFQVLFTGMLFSFVSGGFNRIGGFYGEMYTTLVSAIEYIILTVKTLIK